MTYSFVIDSSVNKSEGLVEVYLAEQSVDGVLMVKENDFVLSGEIVHSPKGGALEDTIKTIGELKSDEVVMIYLHGSTIPNVDAKVAYILKKDSQSIDNFLTDFKKEFIIEDTQLNRLVPIIIKGKLSKVNGNNGYYAKSALGDGVFLENTAASHEFNKSIDRLNESKETSISTDPLV